MTMKIFITSLTVAALFSSVAMTKPAHAGDGGQLIGALIGAAGGAAIGSNVGKGDGRTAAIAAGALIGASLGGNVGKSHDRTHYGKHYRHGKSSHYNRKYHGRHKHYGHRKHHRKHYYHARYRSYPLYGHTDYVIPNTYHTNYYPAQPAPVQTNVVQVNTTPQAERYCREFTQMVQVGGQPEESYGTACRQPDGSWEIQQ